MFYTSLQMSLPWLLRAGAMIFIVADENSVDIRAACGLQRCFTSLQMSLPWLLRAGAMIFIVADEGEMYPEYDKGVYEYEYRIESRKGNGYGVKSDSGRI